MAATDEGARRIPGGSRGYSVEDSIELYSVDAWGAGYFGINAAGHVVVRPRQNAAREIDLYEVVTALRERDLTAPMVIRFSDILKFRIEQPIAIDTVGLAVQSAIEHVFLADGSPRGMAVATNVFMRTPTGWRMVCHHSSPTPAVAAAVPAGPLH